MEKFHLGRLLLPNKLLSLLSFYRKGGGNGCKEESKIEQVISSINRSFLPECFAILYFQKGLDSAKVEGKHS